MYFPSLSKTENHLNYCTVAGVFYERNVDIDWWFIDAQIDNYSKIEWLKSIIHAVR